MEWVNFGETNSKMGEILKITDRDSDLWYLEVHAHYSGKQRAGGSFVGVVNVSSSTFCTALDPRM